jgi:hypothetical protein
MAVVQPLMYWLTHCYREQAPSHIWFSNMIEACVYLERKRIPSSSPRNVSGYI